MWGEVLKNLAIIPARSGSKGLKDKNIRLLNGKPLLAYTIDAAKGSGLFEEIMVSTDSIKYAEISKQYGANVPFLRDEELSNDTASSWDVAKDVIKKYKQLGREFDTVALLQPTSPLRTSVDIIKGYKVMNEKSANVVVGVCETDHSPLWTNTIPADGSMASFINKEILKTTRQKLPKFYRINGALYIVRVKYLMDIEEGELYKEKCYSLIMQREHSIDIDEELDFLIAGVIIKNGGV